MKTFQTLRTSLLAAIVALIMGGQATISWADTKKADEKPAAAALVDINTATAADLENVPGIGAPYARKIIAHRPYATVSDLSKSGIPAARLEKILPLVTVAEKAAAKEKPAATSGKTATAPSAGTPAAGTPAALVDINSATAEQLETIPGVGPTYAKKIIAARPFASVKDLSKAGIPAARLEKILPLVTAKVAATEKPAGSAGSGAASEKTAATSGKTAAVSNAETPAALVDINTATAEQLETIPGVGPAYAKKIIAARPFASVKDLSKAGIPAARLEKILPLVTAGQAAVATEKPAATAKPAGGSSTAASQGAKTEKPAETTEVEARTPPAKGMVWANTASKVYHVEGDHWYGKTKKGEWMTEDDAIKAGYRKAK